MPVLDPTDQNSLILSSVLLVRSTPNTFSKERTAMSS